MQSIGIGILSLMALITLAGGALLYAIRIRKSNRNLGKDNREE